MSKISNAFENGTAFIGFLTAGDPTIDKTVEYILAMEHGFPPISGIGFGIDVFIYHLLDCENIRDTILFPITKPLDNEKEDDKNED